MSHRLFLVLVLISAFICSNSYSGTKKIPVKVVVVTMYESGAITGDRPGEFQLWVERKKLDQTFEFPLGEYPLRMNDKGVLGICLGVGISNATASIMALGMDPRFDLSKAYWLVAGISGGDPNDISLGSAAWAKHIVDGDLVYEIDAREIPDEWPYGLIPLGAKKPAKTPDEIHNGWTVDTVAFSLNESLVDWAYGLTKDVKLPQGNEIKNFRNLYTDYPNARKPPFVMIGDTLSSSTYWHGKHMNQWANDWVKLHRGNKANFVTTNMEDSGTLTALMRLARTNIIDRDRILVLRTASNYSMAPAGKPTSWSVTATYPDEGLPSLETAFIVGNTVVEAIVRNWQKYKDSLPGV